MNNTFKSDQLKSFAQEILGKAGLSISESDIVAESLIEAELRGLGSHGLTRLRTYSKRVKTKVVSANVEPVILNSSKTALLVEGCNGMGASIGSKVMQICIDRAKEYGTCFATVNRGNHFGIAAYFTMQAARQNMIGIAMSNAPASVVPTGGKKPMLGTNPLSVAIPAGKYPPLVLDMACSVVAQGKVILAANEGKDSIPPGWAVDENGEMTTDPQTALRGAMLPFGGPKGYAIAFIVDILCSVLSGALNSTRIRSYWNNFKEPQDLGYFFGALNIESFLDIDSFKNRMDSLFEEMKSCPPARGYDQVYIPGELEYLKCEEAKKSGIQLGVTVVEDLKKLGNEYGVHFCSDKSL
jgi:LDH2 family malate/lactate/ureidoglycolate dehydrogenase